MKRKDREPVQQAREALWPERGGLNQARGAARSVSGGRQRQLEIEHGVARHTHLGAQREATATVELRDAPEINGITP